MPSWLWRSVPDTEALAHLPEKERFVSETSARQVFDRLAGCWTYWGWKGNYFSSKTAPRAMSSWTRAGPSSTSTRTASASHRPTPAASVSARWRSVESGSLAEHGRHAALGPPGGGLRQLALGEHAHPHAVHVRRPHRGRQPGDAATPGPAGRARRRPSEGVYLLLGTFSYRRRPKPCRERVSVRPAPRRSGGARAEVTVGQEPAVASSTCRLAVSTWTIAGLVAVQLGLLVVGVADDDDPVAGLDKAGGGAVEADVARRRGTPSIT